MAFTRWYSSTVTPNQETDNDGNIIVNGNADYTLPQFLNASALEHAVIEDVFNTDAVSTIKGFQNAVSNSHNIVTIAAGTASATIHSQLSNLPVEVRNDIVLASANGFEITVPDEKTLMGNWSGAVYLKKIVDGSGTVFGAIIDSDTGEPASGGAAQGQPNGGPAVTRSGGAGGKQGTGDPVHISNGNMYRDEIDLQLPNIGLPLEFARHYDSQNESDRGFGTGWSFTFGDQIELVDLDNDNTIDEVAWIKASGTSHTFPYDGTNFTTPGELYGTLDVDSGSLDAAGVKYTFVDKHGLTHEFTILNTGDEAARLTRIEDRNGNQQTIAYNANDKIASVTDTTDPASSSTKLTFGYSGSTQTVTDWDGRTWTYSFSNLVNSSSRVLTQVDHPTDARTEPVTVGYQYYDDGGFAQGLISHIVEPNGGTHTYTYYPNGRAFEVSDAEGYTTSLSYNLFRGLTEFTDERGHVTQHFFDDDELTVREVKPDRTRQEYEWANRQMTSHIDAFRSG